MTLSLYEGESSASLIFSDPEVYERASRMARLYLRREVLYEFEAEDLVHEAYLRLCQHKFTFQEPAHFYAVLSVTMRRVLIDRARAAQSQKRAVVTTAMDESGDLIAPSSPLDEILMVDEALDELKKRNPEAARIIELKYFGGYTTRETTEMLNKGRTGTFELLAEGMAFLNAYLTK